MNFASLLFAAFLPVVLAIDLGVRRHAPLRTLWRLLASYAFYAAWDWRFLGLILTSTLVDYVAARRIEAARASQRGARRWLLLSVGVNLGILVACKYAGFFAEGFADLAGAVGWQVGTPTLQVLLPVGVSFYTFQTIGYTVDVYRGDVAAERSLPTFALFVAWFPQLVAGPIERAGRLLPQIHTPRAVTWQAVHRAVCLIAVGLFKKVVLADNIAYVVNRVFEAGDPARGDVLIGVYAFAIQIYCDFSGYTDIARGTSKLFGVELMQNFDRPYLASSPRAFWQRWHISLSTWFRDYVYIPLGGGRTHAVRNVLVVFALAGLWHGAAWTFLAWGLFHGLWLLAWRAAGGDTAHGRDGWRTPLGILITFHGVCFGWLLFRAASLTDAWRLLTSNGASVLGDVEWRIVLGCAGMCVLAAVLRTRSTRRDWIFGLPFPVRVGAYLVLWFGIVLYGVVRASPFVYFQF